MRKKIGETWMDTFSNPEQDTMGSHNILEAYQAEQDIGTSIQSRTDETVSVAWEGTFVELAGFVTAVLDVPTKRRGHVLKLTEESPLGSIRTCSLHALEHYEMTNPTVSPTQESCFDGTRGITLNKRTRIRYQEMTPSAA